MRRAIRRQKIECELFSYQSQVYMDQMVAVTMLCLVDYLISTLALGAPVPTELAGWDRAGTSCNFSLAMRDPEVTG